MKSTAHARFASSIHNLVLLALVLALMATTGCSQSGNDVQTGTAEWTLVYAGGGLDGGEITPEHDGITLKTSTITYFHGRRVLRILPVSDVAGTSIFDGLSTTLLLIDGMTYVKVLHDGQLDLKQNAPDAYSFTYSAGVAD